MRDSTRAWVTVILLWTAGMLNYLDRQVIFSVIPLIRKDLALSDVDVGWIGTLFFWVYAACSPLAGFLADRYGHKRVIVASLCFWSLITALTGVVETREQLLAARALMGISEACYLPAALALIAAHHSGQTRSKATGLHFSGIYAGVIAGGVLGGGWVNTSDGAFHFDSSGSRDLLTACCLHSHSATPPRVLSGRKPPSFN